MGLILLTETFIVLIWVFLAEALVGLVSVFTHWGTDGDTPALLRNPHSRSTYETAAVVGGSAPNISTVKLWKYFMT